MADDLDLALRRIRGEPVDDLDAALQRLRTPHGVISDVTRGLATGLATTGTSLVGGLGTLTGSEGLREWARQSEEEARAYYDPRGRAGTVGEFIGRGAGEIATGAGLGKAAAVGAARFAPRVAAALTDASRLRRVGATMAVNAPVDILQGASQGEGVVLPGTVGAIAENVLFSGAAGALPVRGAKDAKKAAETEAARIAREERVKKLYEEPGSPISQAMRDFQRFRAGYGPRALEVPIRETPNAPTVREAIEQMRERSAAVARRERDAAELAGRTATTTKQYDVLAGPEIPAGQLSPENAEAWLADVAQRASASAEEPLIQGVEIGRRSRQQQAAYIRSVRKTAEKLEREAARRRALPSPDMDAIKRIEDAASEGRRIAGEADAGLIVSPDAGFNVYGGIIPPQVAKIVGERGIGAVLGAGAGAGTAEEGDTGDLVGRMALGAAAGFGLGSMASNGFRGVRQLANAPSRLSQAFADARTAYERRLAAGTAGTEKKADQLFNQSLRSLDSTGRELWKQEQQVLEQAGETRRLVSDAEVKQFAKAINVDEIVARDLRKLDTVQLAALGNRITEDRAQLDKVFRQLEDVNVTSEQLEQLKGQRDALLNRLVGYDRVYNTAGSEQGRGLRILGRFMLDAGKVDITNALRAARRALDLPSGTQLSDAATNAIKGVFSDSSLVTDKQKAEALAKVIDDMRGGTLLDVLLDNRRAGLLAAPFSWATNILGSVGGAAETAIANPVAAALDNMWVRANGLVGKKLERTVTFGGRGAAYQEKFREMLPDMMARIRRGGVEMTNPLQDIAQQKINYVNALGLSPADGEAAWRKTLRGGAKILQAANDGIYRIMTETDRPFYEASLAAAFQERAVLRAMNEMPRAAWKGPEFTRRVAELMNPMTAHPTDAAMAVAEALDATFKTPTRIARMAREAGSIGAYVAPFANTPTNLIRRGLESIPGVGFIPAATQTRNIADKLKRMGVAEKDIANEVRRYRTKVLGRQLTTGAGSILAGYMLAKSGQLTQEYVEPIGASPEERDEMKRRQLTGQAPLTLRVGDTAVSLAPFATLIPGISIGAALAQADEDESIPLTQIAATAGMSALRTTAELPVLQGVKNLTEILAGRSKAATFGRELSSFLPFSSATAALARGIDTTGKRKPETFAEGFAERIPFLRGGVAPDVGVFGETQPSAGILQSMLNPLRPSAVRTGGIYDVLQEVNALPSKAAKRTGESEAVYAQRRQVEGPQEKALLEDLIAGNPRAWAFVPAGARRKFDAAVREGKTQGAWRELLGTALSQQRRGTTDVAKSAAERQALLDGYRRNTSEFNARVQQILAGQ